jgi:hypothetical protein
MLLEIFVGGGKSEVFVLRELLVSRSQKRLERNTLIGLDVFNKPL